jgi:hypothetical protein
VSKHAVACENRTVKRKPNAPLFKFVHIVKYDEVQQNSSSTALFSTISGKLRFSIFQSFKFEFKVGYNIETKSVL